MGVAKIWKSVQQGIFIEEYSANLMSKLLWYIRSLSDQGIIDLPKFSPLPFIVCVFKFAHFVII